MHGWYHVTQPMTPSSYIVDVSASSTGIVMHACHFAGDMTNSYLQPYALAIYPGKSNASWGRPIPVRLLPRNSRLASLAIQG